jgi:cysteine synthase
VETVTNDEAFTWARRARLASEEGILGGISTGANVAAAARLAAKAGESRQGDRDRGGQLRRALPLDPA